MRGNIYCLKMKFSWYRADAGDGMGKMERRLLSVIQNNRLRNGASAAALRVNCPVRPDGFNPKFPVQFKDKGSMRVTEHTEAAFGGQPGEDRGQIPLILFGKTSRRISGKT